MSLRACVYTYVHARMGAAHVSISVEFSRISMFF